MLRWAAWGLLVLGPVLGATAFARTSAASPAQPSVTASAPTATGSQGAAGFATLFVAQHLRAGEGDQDKLAAYYPAAADMQLEVSRTSATASSSPSCGCGRPIPTCGR
ncbi:hypothetical protein [Streptomyces sp. NPDC007856]|uniref:hypothetical protein n=1 Tax=Streptomyces sp. NPDC007856 TaxID=3364781 RepID=UPI0036C018AE